MTSRELFDIVDPVPFECWPTTLPELVYMPDPEPGCYSWVYAIGGISHHWVEMMFESSMLANLLLTGEVTIVVTRELETPYRIRYCRGGVPRCAFGETLVEALANACRS